MARMYQWETSAKCEYQQVIQVVHELFLVVRLDICSIVLALIVSLQFLSNSFSYAKYMCIYVSCCGVEPSTSTYLTCQFPCKLVILTLFAMKTTLLGFVHLYNRTPVRRIDWKTPYEKLKCKVPDVSHLYVFVCGACLHS